MLYFSSRARALAVTLALPLLACSASPSGYYGGGSGVPTHAGAPSGYGATPGGAQDIAHARALVAAGTVPAAAAITVEGLLSEHDIPIDGAPCTDLLCARPSVAVAPSLATGAQEQWMVLGMSSGIVDFRRPPIDLAFVIDASSAMSIDMAQVREAASRVVRALRPDDRIAVVVFRDGAEVMQHMTPRGDDPSALVARIQGIGVSGGAAFLPGLEAGYAEVRAAGDDRARLRRVVTFSCGYAPSDVAALTALVQSGGAERIGLTFVGVLLGFDDNLASLLNHHRGGNSFYTGTLEQVAAVFDTDLDFTLTPLAYDLHLELALDAGWHIAHVYGVPGNMTGMPRAGIDVSTAFISHNHGAIVVRLTRDAGAADAIGSTTLSYVPESALGWEAPYDVSVPVSQPAAASGSASYGGNGVRKAVALVNEAEQLQSACTAWAASDRAHARAITDTLLTYLRAEADATADADLAHEVTFVQAFRALLGT